MNRSIPLMVAFFLLTPLLPARAEVSPERTAKVAKACAIANERLRREGFKVSSVTGQGSSLVQEQGSTTYCEFQAERTLGNWDVRIEEHVGLRIESWGSSSPEIKRLELTAKFTGSATPRVPVGSRYTSERETQLRRAIKQW